MQCYQKYIPIRPFSGIYHGNQYLHLGQYLNIRDENGMEFETVITHMTWKFRGGQQITCISKDSRAFSQDRKRSQGERMKTQINRQEDKISAMNAMTQKDYAKLEYPDENTLYVTV